MNTQKITVDLPMHTTGIEYRSDDVNVEMLFASAKNIHPEQCSKNATIAVAFPPLDQTP